MQSLQRIVIAIVLLSIGAARVEAQSTFGAVVGTIVDATGGVLPGVSIVAKNARSAFSRENQAHEKFQRRGFARTVRAEKPKDLTPFDGQGKSVKSAHLLLAREPGLIVLG